MHIGDPVKVSGYITKEKFIAGRTLTEIEDILGYRRGRFAKGIVVVHPTRLPLASEFELAAYSMVAEHRYQEPGGLDIGKLKQLAIASWTLLGLERLVKVWPSTPHDLNLEPDTQYPPGRGAPQWKLTTKLDGIAVDIVERYPDGRYRPKA
ncbi:MAG: hypothetical protein WBL61_20970 [Bryobacteraceae bacterium]